MTYCIIHFAEIGLKKANRGFFEHVLIENIRGKLGREIKAEREFGIMILSSEKPVDWIKLRHIPAVSNFFIAKHKTSKDLEQVKEAVRDIVEDKRFESFKIETARHNKDFPHKSGEMNKILGQIVVDEFDGKVNLTNPELTVHVKICNNNIYVSSERYEGLGGLPVGSMGHALCLLSAV